jgi:DNA-binding transcriptional MerR regulator
MSNVRLPLLKKSELVRLPQLPPLSLPPSLDAHADDADRGGAVEREGEDAPSMQVGDLARESGKTVRAIHLYEQLELLKPAARSKGRYRLYGREALVRIRWIQKLQDLGFSLTDIKAIVKDVEHHGSASSAMVGVRAVYAKKLEETRSQILRLQSLEGEIRASLAYLEACDSVCERDRLLPACSCCDHHPAEQEVPDLVAGFRNLG